MQYSYQLLPFALMYGQSEYDFWYGNIKSFYAYKKKYEMEVNLKLKLGNQQAWLEGIYFQRAYASCKSEEITYYESPIAITVDEIEQEKRIKEEKLKKEKQKRILDYLIQKMN